MKKSAKWKDGSPCAALMASKVPWSNAKTGSAKALHLITALAVMASCRELSGPERATGPVSRKKLATALISSEYAVGPA